MSVRQGPVLSCLFAIIAVTTFAVDLGAYSGNGVTCGLTALNQAYCWGLNSSGQGGVGHQLGNLTPNRVLAPTN